METKPKIISIAIEKMDGVVKKLPEGSILYLCAMVVTGDDAGNLDSFFIGYRKIDGVFCKVLRSEIVVV